jgi:acetyl-CoA/propionyl-CoA carboxylase biotin carboxyl carrier protein
VANGARRAKKPKRRERGRRRRASADGKLVSPLQGTVLKVNVEKGATVEEGALICVIEAMKMENEITAPAAGRRGARRVRGRRDLDRRHDRRHQVATLK